MDSAHHFDKEGGVHFASEPASSEARRRRASEGEAELDGRLSRRATSKDVTTAHDASGQSDPDTCRICRGEATPDEPLFYPCKCSGSIKYVHQDCLMEWLSHSQKKHCELCKTPFRFTKLYAPNMPKSVPFFVFISHITKYFFRNILVWLRATLVLTVWMLCLPLLMRKVWSFLFWISDEGMGGEGPLFGRQDGSIWDTAAAMSTLMTTVCPSSPLFAETTTPASIGNIMAQISPNVAPQLITTLYGINITSVDPLPGMLLRLLFGSSYLSGTTSQNNISTALIDGLSTPVVTRHPTLLSDVKFIHKISPSAGFNNLIVAIFEGQIITILVIICFILIILVRDYVVQQQPEINMRAAFAAAENAQQPPAPADPTEGLQPEEIDQLRGPEHPDVDDSQHEDGIERAGPELAGMDGAAPADGLQLGPATEVFRRHDQPHALASTPNLSRHSSLRDQLKHHDRTNRDVTDEEGSAVQEYMRIYREAAGDPEAILRIARQENLEDKLAYWIDITQAMADRRLLSSADGNGEASESTAAMSTRASYATSASPASEVNWTWPDDLEGDGHPGSSAKGKEKIVDQLLEFTDDIEQAVPSNTSRPRSATDGPQRSATINPLANNSWSFSESPQEFLGPSIDTQPASFAEPMHDISSFEPVGDTPSSGLDQDTPIPGWDYPLPPSSTLLESRPLSSQHGTPGSSKDSERAADGPPGLFAGTNNTVQRLERTDIPMQGRTSAEWESLPDLNEMHDAQNPIAAAAAAAAAEPNPHQPAGIAGRLADFMWRDVDAIDPNELAPLPDVVVDDGFFEHEDDDLEGEDGDELDHAGDQEMMEAAAAGIDADAEAIEDAEDLEGILELVGMRGPVAGLFQNAIFCAFLVSITIFLGIFIPYNIGRVAVWSVANPMRPLRILFSAAKFVQDLALLAIGLMWASLWWGVNVSLFFVGINNDIFGEWAKTAWGMSGSAAARIFDSFTMDLPLISALEMRNFSAISHGALLLLKERISLVLGFFGSVVTFVFGGDYPAKAAGMGSFASHATRRFLRCLVDLPAILSQPGSWVIDLDTSGPPDMSADLASWSAMDRVWAVFAGYFTMCLIAGLYLRRGSPLSNSRIGQEWEASIIDGLNQASGVMKVILIIGIEMLIFPLYCGLLLDAALLPLFENTTLMSRLMFTVNYPLTSIFVHWFVGTGYMFHFALFVSMCRKIMRKGVLYFIRDPDDPEFHPVRDVLERNVTTQLRKILFSAFVYGALVIVCLGGVVWGLAFAAPDVLPIHYSSNEPVLEFPIDLLFYNFLMPLAIKFFKPSDALHAMYTWWFRKCARGLRVSWFLFGERRIDEEGTIQLRPGSQFQKSPWWRRQWLELSDQAEVVPKTWRDIFEGGQAKPAPVIAADKMALLTLLKTTLVDSQQLVPNGRFVRAPASDQVKIPKGWRVFLDVDENNNRIDDKPSRTNYTDLYDTAQFQFVYVPPHFRARVFLFIMFIWMFAAVTGVGFTIIPLVFGRHLFQMLIPDHIRTNDIYAFSIGVYVLGSAAHIIFHIGGMYMRARERMRDTASVLFDRDTLNRVKSGAIRATKLTYAYFFLLVVFPLMVSSLMELYFLIPLDTYMYSAIKAANPAMPQIEAQLISVQNPRHTIRAMQSWTIGVIYLKLAARVVQSWYRHTRLAAATRAVLRRGWLEPDVKVLTRAFVVPALLLWISAVFGPLLLATLFIQYNVKGGFSGPNDAALVLVYRFCFVATLVCVAALCVVRSMMGVFRSWKVRIRDEAYLIGERLHNFGLVQAMHDRQERERRRARVRWHED